MQIRWMWLWLLSAAVATAAGGYFRPHYFLLMVPPLALLASVGVVELVRALPVPTHRSWLGVVTFAALMLAWSIWSASAAALTAC